MISQQIVSALTGTWIKVDDIIKFRPTFYDDVRELAKKIYMHDTSSRTLEDVYESTLRGEIGEIGIMLIALAAGFEVGENIEELTKQKYWDLMIDGQLCEIKLQSSGKAYFSFSSDEKDRLLRKYHHMIDLIIAFEIVDIKGEMCIVPTKIIDAAVIGTKFYRESHYKGHFLDKDTPSNFIQNL